MWQLAEYRRSDGSSLGLNSLGRWQRQFLMSSLTSSHPAYARSALSGLSALPRPNRCRAAGTFSARCVSTHTLRGRKPALSAEMLSGPLFSWPCGSSHLKKVVACIHSEPAEACPKGVEFSNTVVAVLLRLP